MVRIAFVVAMAAATVMALPQPQLTPDPNGDKNVGNGVGGQFITGACLSDADCASACCAVLGAGGICSGPAVSFAQGKQGCGFGGAGAGAGNNNNEQVQQPPAAGNGNGNAAGSQNVGLGNGSQFITGACVADADCASTCCAPAANGGTCAARLVAEEDGRGCGFGGAADNGNNIGDITPAPPAGGNGNGNGNAAIDQGAAGSQNVGLGNGSQFITGQCLSDADCASTCCAPAANGAATCAARLVAEADGRNCGFSA